MPVVFVDPDASGLPAPFKILLSKGCSSHDAVAFMDSVDKMRLAAFVTSLTFFVVRGYRPQGSLKPLTPIDGESDSTKCNTMMNLSIGVENFSKEANFSGVPQHRVELMLHKKNYLIW